MKAPTCPKCGRTMHRGAQTPDKRIRWQCRPNAGGSRAYCYSTTNPESTTVKHKSGRNAKTPIFKRALSGATRFVVTAAQNGTPVHPGFLAALQGYCQVNNAELLVVPIRYKNPTSRWTASQANEELWSPELVPYLFNQRRQLAKGLILLGDIKTQPTATSPLNGFEAITHRESGILAHTKLQLRTVPSPSSHLPKILTTTGACTVANYTDSKAGKLGEFHHTLGACLVEVRGKKFHLRQLNADKKTGAFQDLTTLYAADGISDAPIAALVMGDTHVDCIDPAVLKATFGAGGMVDQLKPGVLAWHDLIDGESVNPHHEGNPFIAVSKRASNTDIAEDEVRRALDFVLKHTPRETLSVIVPSNHDDFLRRWLVSKDWKKDPINARFYLQTALAMVEQAVSGGNAEKLSPFAYLAKQFFYGRDNVKVLGNDECFTAAGIELGMHGDRGPNGARGSRINLRRIGIKSVIGHSHSPGIEEGCYQVGTSTRLRLSYNSGPSSWLNTHCVVYSTGKRSLINIIDGEWRA
jgi:hypothetical protein